MAKGELKIDGVRMPPLRAIGGLTVDREKIWSKKTGRSASGTFIGDIIRIVTKLKLEFIPLTDEQARILDAAISKRFFTVTYWDPATNSEKTITCYAGTPSYPVYSYVNGIKTYSGVRVDLIQK